MQTPAEIAALHFASYNVPAQLFAAPGRVNLIGEHTDYCDGFVMPAAIDFCTIVAISHRADGRIVAHSINFDECVDKSLSEFIDEGFATRHAGRKVHWTDYIAGVLWVLREHGVPVDNGFSFTIAGDVPLGAGLEAPLASVRKSPPPSPSSEPPASTCPSRRLPCSASAPKMNTWVPTSASWTSTSPAAAPKTTPS